MTEPHNTHWEPEFTLSIDVVVPTGPQSRQAFLFTAHLCCDESASTEDWLDWASSVG